MPIQNETLIKIVNYHGAQKAIETGRKRFNVISAGRRFGKDVYMETDLILRAGSGKHPGRRFAWFAPEYRMMTDNYKEIYNVISPAVQSANKSEHRLELVNGSIIDFWSLDNFNAARGRKYHNVKINEAAASPNLIDAWNYVIRPTLADYHGGADFGSTPKGLNGFYTLWRDAEGNPDWARFHFTTYDNPYIPIDEIEAMKASLPERVFKQEILAEFVEDGSYFQKIDEAAIVEQPEKPEDHKGHHFVMAADWGLSGDFTVLGVACRECNRCVDWDRFTGLEFVYQRERLYTLYDRWHPEGVLPERNSFGEPNIEIIQQRGVSVMSGPDHRQGFTTTATTKPPLIQGLAAAIEHSGFKVPKLAADELRMYEVESMLSGHQKFSAPNGSHDDWVMMLAILWYAMVGGVPGWVNFATNKLELSQKEKVNE